MAEFAIIVILLSISVTILTLFLFKRPKAEIPSEKFEELKAYIEGCLTGLASASSIEEMREVLDKLPKKTLDSLIGQIRPLTGKLSELIATLELTEYDRLFYLGDKQPADFLAIKFGENEGIYFVETKTGEASLTEDEKKLKQMIETGKVKHLVIRVEKISVAEPQEIKSYEAG